MASNRKSKKSPTNAQSESQPIDAPVLAWQLRQEMTLVTEAVAEMKQFQDFLSEQLDQLQQDLRKTIKDQQDAQRQLLYRVERLEVDVERARRVRNVMIFGFPAKPNEDVVGIVVRIGSVLGCHVISRQDIEEARRLAGERSPPIRVVFSDERNKRELMEGFRRCGQLMLRKVDSSFAGNGRIFVRDDVPKIEKKFQGSLNSLCSK